MRSALIFLVCVVCIGAKRLTPPRDSGLPAWMEWGTFENFGKTQTMDNVLLARPTNLNEVKTTIAYGKANNYRVRAGGHCHSWSPLFTDNQNIVLFTRGIQPGTGESWISLNADRSEVTIMTGVNTGELKDFLLTNKLTILSNVILQVVEMGGVVGAICHGVGNTEGTVSDYVVQMRIVNSNGELVTYDFRGEHSNTDKTNAVKGHLGLFGIVYDMTLAVEDEIIVDVVNTWDTVQEVFYNEGSLKKILDENWSVELFWFPYNNMPFLNILRLIGSDDGVLKDDWWDPFNDRVWGRIINPSTSKERIRPEPAGNPLPIEYSGGLLQPKYTPLILQTVSAILQGIYKPTVTHTEPLMTAIHYEPASLMASKVPSLDMEVAIDAGANYANVIQAVTDFRVLMKQYGLNGMYPVNIALEMRLVRNSNILLAPAQAGDPYTMYIEVLSIQHTGPWEQFLKDLAKKWTAIGGCRFHWAKQWRVLGGQIDDFMRTSYGTNMETFKSELASSGADPLHMFSNAMFDSVLFHDTPDFHNATCQKFCCD